MKIAIDARYLSDAYSGVGVYSENLITNLAEIDKDNEYVVIVHSRFNRMLHVGKNFRVVKFRSRPVSLGTLFMLSRFVNEFSPDVLHSLFPLAPVFYRGNILVTVHDLQPLMVPEFTGKRPFPFRKGYDMFYRSVYPHTLRKAKWIITVSNTTRCSIEEMMPELHDRIIVVLSGIEQLYFEEIDPFTLSRVEEKYALPERYVLYIGSTRPNKNLPHMIRAFAQLVKSGPDFSDLHFALVVTTDRFFPECLRLIQKLEIENNVRIIKSVTDEEKRALYKKAQLLYFVTKFEGFGFPVLEAQAVGTPVLASNDGSLPEILGSSALLVDPDNIEEMTEGLRRILEDEEYASVLHEEGLANSKKYSWKSSAQKVLEVYSCLF
jgi:glycosyltransferase involved in cell wall biosynthesis